MKKKKAIVLGWYGKNNIGDQLFIDAFKLLFPNLDFIFTDQINNQVLENNDASILIIGGGSFLNLPVNCVGECWEKMKSFPNIFYIGVGAETEIHPSHLQLLKRAKLIAVRTPIPDELYAINKNIIYIPDIVYYCKYFYDINSTKIKNSLLFVPNIYVVPKNNDYLWKYNSWESFKTETAQFLDELIDDGYKVSFLGMCKNDLLNDDWAAIEILNRMKNRSGDLIISPNVSSYDDVINLFNSYELVITQRFHGIVLAESCNTNYISIHHSDKLNSTSPSNGSFLSYFEVHKNKLKSLLKKQKNHSYISHLDEELFYILQKEVNSIIG